MEIRELKDYRWVFDDNKVILVSKRVGAKDSFPLSMPMADSVSRACIGFRNRYRIEQIMKLRELLKKTKESHKKVVAKLKLEIDRLKEKENV